MRKILFYLISIIAMLLVISSSIKFWFGDFSKYKIIEYENKLSNIEIPKSEGNNISCKFSDYSNDESIHCLSDRAVIDKVCQYVKNTFYEVIDYTTDDIENGLRSSEQLKKNPKLQIILQNEIRAIYSEITNRLMHKESVCRINLGDYNYSLIGEKNLPSKLREDLVLVKKLAWLGDAVRLASTNISLSISDNVNQETYKGNYCFYRLYIERSDQDFNITTGPSGGESYLSDCDILKLSENYVDGSIVRHQFSTFGNKTIVSGSAEVKNEEYKIITMFEENNGKIIPVLGD